MGSEAPLEPTEPLAAMTSLDTSKQSNGVEGKPSFGALPQYLHDAVARIAPQEGFTPGQFEVSFEVGSNKGDGFVAEMFRARIVEGNRELVILCKIPPTNDARREQFNTLSIFDREVQAYSLFLPTITEFQREKGITEELGIGFFNTPKCYLAYLDMAKQESAILMDDLRLQNYRMWDKSNPVNFEHARLLMIQLGRLHAVSFALKEQRPDVFEQFKVADPMTAAMTSSEAFMTMMTMSMDRAIGSLEPNEEKVRQKLEKLKSHMFEDMANLTSSKVGEPYSVLGHGDCWINNLMFAYKKGVPTDIVLLDWQICRYVSPVLDLVYFIFSCTDGELRRKHYDELIRIYYGSLKELLDRLGGDATRQFPFTALLRQLKACGKFGLLMAIFIVPLLCIENKDLPDLDAQAEKFKETQQLEMPFVINEQSEAKYRKRMSDVLRDVIRFGYL
ncbi:uncharacterized protein LOC129775364 [Toxorhynchites rutilus septentrionalis]|uniref:uncharacterized protein LOC129775364 n=1 Tax=Toxorhynchites rutilus septentrionalis TaxID=329112 RepID=UPI00247A9834|nr:uncharacterized protein LOC129775364 [Toxorhynchites rutilus septentrionalis]